MQAIYIPRNRAKKPAKTENLKRTSDDWKKLAAEAKRKEVYWTKGILPGSIKIVQMTDDSPEEEEKDIKVKAAAK